MEEQDYKKLNRPKFRLMVALMGLVLISIPAYKVMSGNVTKPFMGFLTLGIVLLCLSIFGFKKQPKINKKRELIENLLFSVGLGFVVYLLSGGLEASLIIGVASFLYSLRVLAY